MTKQEMRERLEQLSEKEYKEFNQKLIPGVSNMLGVRLPKLREIAKKTAKDGGMAYLEEMKSAEWQDQNAFYYEEKMMYGLMIGYVKMDDETRSSLLDGFVPLIDNWGICDSCCMTYKWMKKQPEYWWDYLNRQIGAGTEFKIRFALVSMLAHFLDEAHIQEIFAVCSRIRSEDYYARMAAAWLISACFVKFPDQTYEYLADNRMDDFTHNKSIQKTCESYRVSKEWKTRIRQLRR